MKINFILILGLLITFSCTSHNSTSKVSSNFETKTNIEKENFSDTIDGKLIDLYQLVNSNGIEVLITNYGARIVSVMTPDKDGKYIDIALGFSSIREYIADKSYQGSIIGRFGNRIKDGKFSIDGSEYSLFLNNGPNSLHGGEKGFDHRVWESMQSGNSVILEYLSKDMEEGYPGNLKVVLTYTLTDDNELVMNYEATTDRKTIINLTNHTYFNLHGEGGPTINDHILYVNANQFTPVDSTLIPTGELRDVKGTPFDFTQPKPIDQDIMEDDEQIAKGSGYDHNFVLNSDSTEKLTLSAKISDPISGRFIEYYTDQPGIQFYGGNFLNGSKIGKTGKPYNYRCAFALEPQHFPDSPNQPNFPSTLLEPGQKYTQKSILKFGLEK